MGQDNYKNWLIKYENKKENTANAYSTAIHKLSKHYSETHNVLIDLYSIEDERKLSDIVDLYGLKGSFSEIGEIGHGTYRNALKGLFRFKFKGTKKAKFMKSAISATENDTFQQTLKKVSNNIILDFNFNPTYVKEAQLMSEYYELFYCLERTIRELVEDVMFQKYGLNWWETKVNLVIKTRVNENLIRELDTGFTERSPRKIDYTTFGDLRQIIRANWNDFSRYFKSQHAFNSIMVALNTLRVPIAHCTPFAEDEIIRLKLAVKDWFRLMK